jgi:hypothetical protein
VTDDWRSAPPPDRSEFVASGPNPVAAERRRKLTTALWWALAMAAIGALLYVLARRTPSPPTEGPVAAHTLNVVVGGGEQS